MVRRRDKGPAMKQVCFTYDKTIALYQTGFDQFTVKYGKQVREELSYGQAARELGCAIMHSVACDGRLDSRDESEVDNGDTEPYFSRPVPAK
jgi:hypothetical protein